MKNLLHIINLILMLSITNVTSDTNGSVWVSLWNTFGTYFSDVFKHLTDGIAYLFHTAEKSLGSTDEEDKVSYSGYQVLRVQVLKKEHAKALETMSEEMNGIKFWTPPIIGHHTDILVTPEALAGVKGYLQKESVNYEVMINDLQKLISYENPKMNKHRRATLISKRGHPMTWTMYHRYSDMLKYMEFLASSFRNLIELITIGYSSKGLPLKVIKVAKPDPKKNIINSKKRNAVWIDGGKIHGMHGREWITSAVVLYIVKELTEKQKNYKKLLDEMDWYLMPVANPDGYEYSHLSDRLWKKTRSKHDTNSNNLLSKILFEPCEGVDLNQNFDVRWYENGESSDDPCSEWYKGPIPFSEPESRAISNFITEHKENMQMFITLHSYSQMWLMPHNSDNKTTHADGMRIAKKAVEISRRLFGTSYGVGMSSNFYPTSSSSQNWAQEIAKIRYPYLVELRDRGHYGFLLPANQILPTAKETFTAVTELVKIIISKHQN